MYSIAIDGPAGAGKSTIAKTIAKKLEFIYVDTGAMYRAMALFFIRSKIDDTDEAVILMDGRDIGTNVLPDADLKIYLTASVEVRAKRRYDELIEKGQEADLAVIEEDIKKRDHQDMTRDIAPLKQAEDAVRVDSSGMTIEEVVDTVIREFEKVK